MKAVDNVNFDLNVGETLALVGESGCGKTTTSHCIIQAQRPTSGRVYFRLGDAKPMDLTQMEKGELKEARRNIRMIYQDPYSSLNPRMTLLQIIGEPLVIHRMVDSQEESARTCGRTAAFGSSGSCDDEPLSACLQRRPAPANCHRPGPSLSPKVVIADEAVSALDVSVQAQILNLLKELQHQLGLTYLFVAHNLAVVKYEADRVAVMYAGKIVEIGETEELYTGPRHPYTEALISAAPNPDPDTKHRERIVLAGEVADPGNLPAGCAFHPRCRYAEDLCRQEAPDLVEVRGGEGWRTFRLSFCGQPGANRNRGRASESRKRKRMTQAAGTAPLDGLAAEDLTDQRVLVASQWQLIRWRFFGISWR